MADNSKIEWTDATWNPITGCSVVSPGCTNCYAMRLAGTRLRAHPSRRGLVDHTKAGPVWNGAVRFNEQWLDQPLRWRRPRRVFVCAHSDLFHDNVPEHWIDRVFAVMASAPQHTFQVLTKRPDRMETYFADRGAADRISYQGQANAYGTSTFAAPPYPNVWLGVSIEDQARLGRLPHLLRTPAAVRFVSFEPLLGPIDLNPRFWPAPLHWAIVGGESGPGARDMAADWARDLRDQLGAAGVAFFMKQMARKAPIPPDLLVREFPFAA